MTRPLAGSFGSLLSGLAFALLALAPFSAHARDWSSLDLGVAAGAGVAQYAGASGVQPGGTWSLRGEASVVGPLRLGLAYVGSANQLASEQADVPPLLVRNSGLATARLARAFGALEPYVEAGAGVARFDVRGGTGESPSRLRAELPLAAGVNLHRGVVLAGVRGGVSHFLGPADAIAGNDLVSGALLLGAQF